jgi:hypothetical protein
MALADAIDAPDALFDLHGVPRQVEVDQQVSALQVKSFGRRIRAY